VVINTTPLITLAVGLGSLQPLQSLYSAVVVPLEVEKEILAQGLDAPGAEAFEQASSWLQRRSVLVDLPSFLRNSLDAGEAAVIQTAINEGIPRVAIDEKAGRRVARLNGLTLTGSLGMIIKANQLGHLVDPFRVLHRLDQQGIWLSEKMKGYFIENIHGG